MWTVGKLPSWIWYGRQMNKSIIEPGMTQEVGGWDGRGREPARSAGRHTSVILHDAHADTNIPISTALE